MFIFLKVNSQLQNAKNSLIIRGLLREWMDINQTCMDMSLCHFERGMGRGGVGGAEGSSRSRGRALVLGNF